MPLVDYLPGRRPVRIADRVFIVREPTVATVETFLRLFPAEIHALKESTPTDVDAQLFFVDIAPEIAAASRGRAAAVLMTCVEVASGDFGDPTEWPLGALAREVVRGFDFARAFESFGGSGSGESQTVHGRASAIDVSLAQTAHYFGCSPIALMDWPFFAFLAAQDAARAPSDEQRKAEPQPVSLDVANAMGRGDL